MRAVKIRIFRVIKSYYSYSELLQLLKVARVIHSYYSYSELLGVAGVIQIYYSCPRCSRSPHDVLVAEVPHDLYLLAQQDDLRLGPLRQAQLLYSQQLARTFVQA